MRFASYCLLLTSFFLSDPALSSDRAQRLLNVFTIVNFPNSACNSTLDSMYGTCYTASECTALGGSSAGSCASGFGVCCSFTGGCGGTTSLNNTYFTSGSSNTSPCKFSVCKSSTDICQIKLNFNTFEVDAPDTTTSTADYTPKTQCLLTQFTAESEGSSSLNTICGKNSGYHMYLEAVSDGCNSLEFTWTSTTSKTWKIHVMQIPCDAEWKAPTGCLQYFTGATGTVYSYNYQAGTSHIANQNYQNCIRTEQGYCSISYTATEFGVNHIAASSLTQTSCSEDYVLIPQGGPTTTHIAAFPRYCGGFLAPSDTQTSNMAVLTQAQPFVIGVVFNAVEKKDELGTKGFAIAYTQSTTC